MYIQKTIINLNIRTEKSVFIITVTVLNHKALFWHMILFYNRFLLFKVVNAMQIILNDTYTYIYINIQ